MEYDYPYPYPVTTPSSCLFSFTGISTCCAKTSTAPLERLKILFQAQNHHYKDMGKRAFRVPRFSSHKVKVYVYMTDIFFICSIKSPYVLIRTCIAKILVNGDFPALCFDLSKTWNFTSSRVQNHETKNRRLGMVVTSFQNFNFCGKQISQLLFSNCELMNLPRNGTKVRCL